MDEGVGLYSLLSIFKEIHINEIHVLDSHVKNDFLTQAYLDPFQFFIEEITPVFNFLCFPDKNAHKNGLFYLNNNGEKPFGITLTKKRTLDGSVITKFPENSFCIKGKNVLINDDICDGGRTFINAAKLLKEHGAKNIYLYVSHGIFSNGLDVLKEAGIDHVYTTNSYCRLPSSDFLTVIDIFKDIL